MSKFSWGIFGELSREEIDRLSNLPYNQFKKIVKEHTQKFKKSNWRNSQDYQLYLVVRETTVYQKKVTVRGFSREHVMSLAKLKYTDKQYVDYKDWDKLEKEPKKEIVTEWEMKYL